MKRKPVVNIINMHNHIYTEEEWNFKVDRSTCFGNPNIMKKESDRKAACIRFRQDFPVMLEKSKAYGCLLDMVNALKRYGCINLFCWCMPKRCHAETIREFVLQEYKKRA